MREPDTGWYLLGERPYNPTLRRFLAPDRASPFDRGGINRYAYCSGDPVNRIDPSGRSWLGWLGAYLGLTQRSAGAAGSMSPTSQGMHEAASTPGTLVSSATAVADTVSIASAIDSVALVTSNAPKAGGLFGWIGTVMTAATGGSALLGARNGSPTRRFFGQDPGTRPKRNVDVVRDKNIPTDRLAVNRQGRMDVTRQWKHGAHTANSRSQIWAVDSWVNYTDFPGLFEQMNRDHPKITDVTIYSGVHGHPYGENWNADTGRHLKPEQFFFTQDNHYAEQMGKSAGINVRVVNVGSMWRDLFEELLSDDGVHVITSCYGIADPVVMDALNLSDVTVYYLSPPAGP
jgi:RHS repeat-associated protein